MGVYLSKITIYSESAEENERQNLRGYILMQFQMLFTKSTDFMDNPLTLEFIP